MRILHVGKFYHPYAGGMETVMQSMCEGLVESGADVTVLCSNTSNRFERNVINGVKVLRSPILGILFSQPLCIFIPIFLMRYAHKYDAIHIHSPNPLVELFSTFVKHPNKHSMHHSDIVRQRYLSIVYNPIYKYFLNTVQKIFVPTTNHIKYSKSILKYQDKCEIVPFFINEDRFPNTEEVKEYGSQFVKKYGRFGLFVGRLVGYKGLDVLIKAAKDVDHKILIVGGGPLKDQLLEQIKSLHLEKQVILLGRIESNEEFAALYRACHYVVLPSVTPNENFGMVQLEGMFCEKPILTTNLKSGVPAVGIPGETTLLVEPGDSKELASEMTRLVDDEVLSKRLGKNGKKLYLTKYQKKTIIKKTIELYQPEESKSSEIKKAA